MSGWLSSVNNLLETLDGQAETVAETVAEVGNQGVAGIDDQIGKLLQNGRQAILHNNRNRTASESYSSDDYTSEDDYDYDDEELYSEVDDEENDRGVHKAKPLGVVPAAQANPTTTSAQPLSVASATATKPTPREATPEFLKREDALPESKPNLAEPVKIEKGNLESNDDGGNEVGSMDAAFKPSKRADNGVGVSLGRNKSELNETNTSNITSSVRKVDSKEIPPSNAGRLGRVGGKAALSDGVEVPPRKPNRADSSSEAVPLPPPKPISNPLRPPQDVKPRKGPIVPQGATDQLAPQHRVSSPKVEESPREPRQVPATGISLVMDAPPAALTAAKASMAAAGVVSAASSGKKSKPVHDSVPPRLPAQKVSDQEVKAPTSAKTTTARASNATGVSASNKNIVNSSRPPTAAAVPPTPRSAPVPAPVAPTANPKLSKEYQKLKEKYQVLQSQMSRTDADLKNAQSKSQALEKEIKNLNSKLDEANNEIHAQGEELQRAGDQMEKDRLRVKEDREDLLDEQEEELEQLRDSHQSEMDQLRNQYEAQISNLNQQLEAEETRRRQEGGDYTQELQDAIQRERDALKKLNQETAEKTELQSSLSKLELQQTALQGRLDSALQSVKTAAEREREAEDKLDSAMSTHARQMSQRQSREAELEKTISELGAALTVAQQQTMASGTPAKVQSSGNETMGDSYKEKYESAAEELETLKVQFGMESQRREALQDELNDISKERAEEASSALTRQRSNDRKVAELESTVNRLQASLREQSNINGKISEQSTLSEGSNPGASSRDLEEAKREIENLSSQLLRQQAISKNAKSETLALKGRLQTATSRAEQAEKSLQTISSTRSGALPTNRLYELEAGVVGGPTGLRRRVKGGGPRARTRTIRAALQMSPGRTNHPFMEQLALTLDAIDTWMVETGAFMRHEPLARLGFMMYLMILHLWSFALVVFHTTEQPHGDFGSMDNNPRHWRAALAQPP